MIFIAGNARSGTSWLGKIFDSHPDVLYRHEPDHDVPANGLPFFIEDDQAGEYLRQAEQYLKTLESTSNIRAVGRLPLFEKSYHTGISRQVHLSTLHAMRLADQIPIVGSRIRRMNVPDLVSNGAKVRTAVKSVVSLGRLNVYRDVLQGHIVLILRHPCAVVASQMRGIRTGKLDHQAPLDVIAGSRVGRQYGLDTAMLEAASMEEQIAWTWLVFNEKAVTAVEESEKAVIVTHERLCLSPMEESRRLFDFTGLSWQGQTEAYLQDMEAVDTRPGYYDLKRNPASEVDKWKAELAPDVIDSVLAVLGRSPLAGYFAEAG